MPAQMVDSVKDTDESPYLVGIATGSEEIGRLDEMSVAFTRYLEGKLCPAHLDGLHPRKILDLGCGTGAWAIQAAMQFPDAEVLAVDVVPLPDRALPPNVRFERVDLEKELMNLEPEAFDIVYSRQVLVHLSNADAVVKRFAQLVKPTGILILADVDFGSMFETGGEATRRFLSHFMTVWNARGADVEFGRKIAESMSSSGLFPAGVNVHRILMPLNGTGADDATNELGIALRKSWLTAADSLGKTLTRDGFTEFMAKEQEAELNQKDCKTVWNMYFCWGQRGLD
ncbi:S-adenosyl-L-methionine-dependent methyltransferase [Mycena sanguinolenta]|uniref:S-adenosyl-L-methionine-dependent methyltransferase n=1 Tax=Mycena sanguinolenta TaxID=230812 RepID=A0A8H6ZJ99_9AGAR|nr:S-adenosyl-L-methionine-dependent methyltransferase [Mycena sanguinolenta]